MSTENHTSPGDIAAVIETVKDLAAPVALEHPSFGFLPGDEEAWSSPALFALPKGTTAFDATPTLHRLLTESLPSPRFLRETATLTSTRSLIDYTLRNRNRASAIFVDDTPALPKMTAIIDYHRPAGVLWESPDCRHHSRPKGDDETGADDRDETFPAPRHGRHRGVYAFPLSEQIVAWKDISGKAKPQAEFATFLQDRRFDIANPPLDWMQMPRKDLDLILRLLNLVDDRGEIDDGAATAEDDEDGDERYIPRSALYKLRKLRFASADRVVQLAQSIEVTVDGKAKSGFNPRTGERQLEFEEEHTTASKGRRVTVPEFFLLSVPLFEAEPPTLIPVRLQYRVKGGTVEWTATLVEWKRVIRLAVADIAAQVAEATGLPVYFGKVE